jgi:flavodoxin
MSTNKTADSISSATIRDSLPMETVSFETLIFLASFHHGNTEKIAREIASVLNAQIVMPHYFNTIANVENCKLIGFGSGIYDQKHHNRLLDLVDKLTFAENQKVFIFSTSGISREKAIKMSIKDPHTEHQLIPEMVWRNE